MAQGHLQRACPSLTTVLWKRLAGECLFVTEQQDLSGDGVAFCVIERAFLSTSTLGNHVA